MKRYTGTKVVNAKPMNRAEYNTFRGWTLPADENGADEGYLIEYVDGGKANVAMYAGYVSWSPKDVFERAYSEVIYRVSVLLPHQQRVVDEKAELDTKLAALMPFLRSDTCLALPFDERGRLHRQAVVMQEYSIILGERMHAFTEQVA